MYTIITKQSAQVIRFSFFFFSEQNVYKAKLQIRVFIQEMSLYTVEYAVVLCFHSQLPVIKLSLFSISTFIKSVWLIVSLLSSSHKPTTHSLGWGIILEVNCRSNSFQADKQLCRTLSWSHCPQYAKKRGIQLSRYSSSCLFTGGCWVDGSLEWPCQYPLPLISTFLPFNCFNVFSEWISQLC